MCRGGGEKRLISGCWFSTSNRISIKEYGFLFPPRCRLSPENCQAGQQSVRRSSWDLPLQKGMVQIYKSTFIEAFIFRIKGCIKLQIHRCKKSFFSIQTALLFTYILVCKIFHHNPIDVKTILIEHLVIS